MTFIEALLLGLLQGLTEFLPISSSGHLILLQTFFDLKDLNTLVLFDLIIHLGTVSAVFCVFYKKIQELLFSRTQIVALSIALFPLVPLLLFIKPIKALFDAPQYLGFFFLLTAAFLYLGIKFGKKKPAEKHKKHLKRDVFLIGISQAFAILPGVSRSGSTVSAARLLGWSYNDALSFSFLLAIPTILGAAFIESIGVLKGTTPIHPNVSYFNYLVGFFSAFFSGILTLKFLIRLGNSDKWMIFVWYCLILGISTIIYFNA